MEISAKKKALLMASLPLLICATLITNTIIWGMEGFFITTVITIGVGMAVGISVNVYRETLQIFEKKTK
jgi:hypothetical protein